MKRKGFTLIELIVVIAIIGILVFLGLPKYLEYTQDARITRLMVETKELEKASQKYYMTYSSWPKLTDEPYTSEEVVEFSEKIRDVTGKVVVLEETGNYYDIDYSKLGNYITKSSNPENYILQNPVGSVYSLDKPTEIAKARITESEIIVEKSFEFIGTFTNAGAEGRFGPSQSQLDSSYIGSVLEGKVVSNNGIQLWTVPKDGAYRIEAYGAQGGTQTVSSFVHTGGLGAIMKGDLILRKGDTLKILVGQIGVNGEHYTTGGGGGTFIVDSDNIPLIVAGGGGAGGSGDISGSNASTSINGKNGLGNNLYKPGLGGVNGYAGQSGYGGWGSPNKTGSGGGFYSGGVYAEYGSGGMGFIQGCAGGIYNSNFGGFGGGGASNGGGGGYSGGGGGGFDGTQTGTPWTGGRGGGGGSYNSGTNQSNTVGNTSHGKVMITYIGE